MKLISRRSGWPRRILKWGGLALATLTILLIAGALAFQWNWLKGAIQDRASSAVHRDVAIEGDIDGEWSLVPRITISGLRVANAAWAKPEEMLRVDRLELRIDLLELLKGSVVLPEVSIVGGELHLQKNAQGETNWNFAPVSEAGAAAEATLPDERAEFPEIGRLTIERSKFTYNDPSREIDFDGQITQAKGEGQAAQDTVSLVGKGTLEERPLTIRARGASVIQLRDEAAPYPVNIELSVGDTHIAFDGSLNPLQPGTFDIALDLSGPSLSELFPVFGIPLPPTPPYSLTGRLKRNGANWTVDGLDGRVGDSDLTGNLTIDADRAPPFMRAKLLSHLLDFDDLAGFIGATPETSDGETASQQQREASREAEQDQRILPNMAIDLDRLRAMDMKVGYSANRINAPNMPLENFDATLTLEKGLLTLKPLEFATAGGTIGGTLILDGRKQMPRVTADLLLRGLSLKPFFAVGDMADLTAGRFGGRIELVGHGRSLAEVLSASNGQAAVAMHGGSVSPLFIEMIGLDIAESLAVVVSDTSTPVPIRCAFGRFKVEDGWMRTDGIVVDTTDSTLIAVGAVNLGAEKLSLTVHAQPKDASPLSANAPIAITGRFHDPSIAIDPTRTAGEGLFDRIISLADPILALLPFVDLGTAEDRYCPALLRGDIEGSKKDKKAAPGK